MNSRIKISKFNSQQFLDTKTKIIGHCPQSQVEIFPGIKIFEKKKTLLR